MCAVGHRPVRVADDHGGHQRRRRRRDHRQSQPGPVVVGADRDAVACARGTTFARRPRRSAGTAPSRPTPTTAARPARRRCRPARRSRPAAARTSNARTRRRFLIGSVSSREISSLPSTSETSSRSVQRTVCGLCPPTFSLIDVATTMHGVGARRELGQLGLRPVAAAVRARLRWCTIRPPPSRPGRWCATAASAPVCGTARPSRRSRR